MSQDRIADIGSYVSETLSQIKTVQAYNHQVQDEQRFATTVEEAFNTARKRIFPAGLVDYPGDPAGVGRRRGDALGRRHGCHRREDFRG